MKEISEWMESHGYVVTKCDTITDLAASLERQAIERERHDCYYASRIMWDMKNQRPATKMEISISDEISEIIKARGPMMDAQAMIRFIGSARGNA